MKWSGTVVLLLALAARAMAAAPSNAECLTCHDKASFKSSVHGVLSCTDCHTTIHGYPHPEHVTRVECATCHAENAKEVAASVHAAVSSNPCQGCHGDPHGILGAKDPKSPIYPLNLPRTCGACHGNPQLAKKYHMPEVYSLYLDSIHGFALTKDGLLVAANCSSCHGTHEILRSSNPHSKTYRKNIPSTCGACHAGPENAYLSGIHGKAMQAGNSQAPVCASCHTAHAISRVSPVSWQMKTVATCGGCHKEKLATYRDAFHAQVSALGYVRTARCWDCHGFHDILPASNPKSTIATANLPTTCGKCHTGVTASFVQYQPHADRHNRKAYPLVYYSSLFMNVLLVSVLGFFGLHTILWLVRSGFGREESGPEPDEKTREQS